MRSTAVSIILMSIFMLTFPTLSGAENGEEIPRIRDKIDVLSLVPILEKGSIVLIHPPEEDGAVQYVTGIVLIDKPFEYVWQDMVDYNKYAGIVPNAEEIKVIDDTNPLVPIVEYVVKIKVFGISVKKIRWTLAQHMEKEKKEIWGVPINVSKKEADSIKGAKYREEFIPLPKDKNRTIFIYTAFANLESFGWAARKIYGSFPGLKTPTMIAVSTLFPEAMKQRIDGQELISLDPKQRKEIKTDLVKISSVETEFDRKILDQILKHYRLVISHHPDESNARFVTGLCRIEKSPEEVEKVLLDYRKHPDMFPFITEAVEDDDSLVEKKGVRSKWSVFFSQEIKIIFSLKIEFTLDHQRTADHEFTWRMNEGKESNIRGNWGRILISPLEDRASLIASTQFIDLTKCSIQYNLLSKDIPGFDLGLRVGSADLFVNSLKEWVEREGE